MAPYLGECLDAQVVVKNEPGAGGLLATNATAVADADERRIMIMNTAGFAAAQIAGADGVQFDLLEFSHVGRIAGAPTALVVAADSDIQTFDDILESEDPVRFVATGPGSEGYIAATGLAEAYDFPIEVITGFPGSGEARTAVVAGDADVMPLTFDSLLGAIEAGEVRPVVLVDEEANELLPDTPRSLTSRHRTTARRLSWRASSSWGRAAVPSLRLPVCRKSGSANCGTRSRARWRTRNSSGSSSPRSARWTSWTARSTRSRCRSCSTRPRVRGNSQGVVLSS
ncbi:tripartite tricarboxylate transporter substrate-binding protein [Blastococcus brunescens]|uniref:Tripartite tricarboxylate transporter substrate-binding protein n=1 Tax=Blastococcus brunescens TaxID=1564165 RepID=A0ABZ1B8R2_9ACTN|nr:tripartite tricarboxylate transporter substrate-binding protein [Blastococcus sp. BMG 8361]WRL67207.1 tripartite tricarboxylate transporter substrate-binding protein [Blastococcus sp. BMG 8361]